MKVFKIFLVVFALAALSSARHFERCELARLLNGRFNFARHELADWICLVEHESSFRSDAIGPPNTDGSRDYGLFQINDRYWCQSDNYPGSSNGCNVRCKEFLGDDISASVRCAQIIHSKMGFPAWEAWKQHCHSPASVDHCFVEPGFHGGSAFTHKWC